MIKAYKNLYQKLADNRISDSDYTKELKRLRKQFNTVEIIKLNK